MSLSLSLSLSLSVAVVVVVIAVVVVVIVVVVVAVVLCSALPRGFYFFLEGAIINFFMPSIAVAVVVSFAVAFAIAVAVTIILTLDTFQLQQSWDRQMDKAENGLVPNFPFRSRPMRRHFLTFLPFETNEKTRPNFPFLSRPVRRHTIFKTMRSYHVKTNN